MFHHQPVLKITFVISVRKYIKMYDNSRKFRLERGRLAAIG